MSNIDYLRDSAFLKDLDNQTLKEYIVKINVLNKDELPIRAIEGRIAGNPTININGGSAVRRTAALSFIALDSENDLEDIDNLLSMNKKISLEIGIYNTTNLNYDNIIWFKLGIFVIFAPTLNHTKDSVIINLSLKDKMCLLNGECGGVLPTSVTFDCYDQLDGNGDRISKKNYIYDIIQTVVCNYGGEDITRIFIDDVNLEIKQSVRYIGDDHLYFNPETGEYKLDVAYIDQFNNGSWRSFDYNDDIGYIYTDFVYPESLITNLGDNVCTVLDKIVTLLGNYEYFYDINGNFIFREKRNYLNSSYDPSIKQYNNSNYVSIIDDNNYEIDFSSSKRTIYEFVENNGLISSYSNTPKYSNIKNDFHIWGKNQDGYAIHYHVAINNKPIYFNTYEVVFMQDENGEYTGGLRLRNDDDINWTRYVSEDWRAELYLQGLSAIKEGRRPTPHQQELLDLFDYIYDFKNKKFKDDRIKPNNLTYWFDYIDPVNKLSNFSIELIGMRSITYQQDTINKLYSLDIPDIILVSQDEDKYVHIERCEKEGQQFSDVDTSVYSSFAIGSAGYSADEVARTLIYQYIDYSQSITIQSVPIYYLDVNSRISVQDSKSGIYGDYIINSISLPLSSNGMMTINASRALERY